MPYTLTEKPLQKKSQGERNDREHRKIETQGKRGIETVCSRELAEDWRVEQLG